MTIESLKNAACRVGQHNVSCWPTQRAASANAACRVFEVPVGQPFQMKHLLLPMAAVMGLTGVWGRMTIRDFFVWLFREEHTSSPLNSWE